MTLSIIIPAFDEEGKIRADILAADRFCTENRLGAEIIVVDDGSADGTSGIANDAGGLVGTAVTVIRNGRNMGKGYSVRAGILRSRGDYVMYADAGTTVPFSCALRGLSLLQSDRCDLAFGSRLMEGSVIQVPQKKDRQMLSKFFLSFVKTFLGVPRTLTDTQCGFKLYKGGIARELFGGLETKGFLFEIEIILSALKKNYRILEFPVEWKCDRDSRISVSSTLGGVLSEAARLMMKR